MLERGRQPADRERQIQVVAEPADFVSANPGFRALLRRVREIARRDVTVLIEGEPGTGKSTLARAIHAHSLRTTGPFVEANLAAIDDGLVGSELFGHVQGAFTGASGSRHGLVGSARGGTLFLDEIGKASKAVQNRLLLFIERRYYRSVGSDREVAADVRIVAASNVPLRTLCDEGLMLADLVPRLSTFRVVLPPLRERPEDIPVLAAACCAQNATKFGYQHVPKISSALAFVLMTAPWHDNVRGLDSTIQRLLLNANGSDPLDIAHCDTDTYADLLGESQREKCASLTPEEAVELVKRFGSIAHAARVSGRARSTIQRQLDRADPSLRLRGL